jgi:hypothetical protein
MSSFVNSPWMIALVLIFLVGCIYEFYQHFMKRDTRSTATNEPVAYRPAPVEADEPHLPSFLVPPPVTRAPPPRVTDDELRQELAAATTIDEVVDVYRSAPHNSPVQHEAVLKAAAMLTAEYEAATTFDACWEAYNAADINLNEDEIQVVRSHALKKVLTLATTAEEALRVHSETPSGSKIEDEAADKVIDLLTNKCEAAKSVADCWRLFNEVKDLDCSWDDMEEIQNKVLVRAVTFIATYQEARDFFDEMGNVGVDDDCDAYANVLDLAIKKAGTFRECMDLHDDLNSHYTEYEDEEDQLLRRACDLAADEEDFEELENALDSDSDLYDVMISKRLGATDSVEVCQGVWDDQGVDSHIGEVAICRAADIIRKRAGQLISPSPVATDSSVTAAPAAAGEQK